MNPRLAEALLWFCTLFLSQDLFPQGSDVIFPVGNRWALQLRLFFFSLIAC